MNFKAGQEDNLSATWRGSEEGYELFSKAKSLANLHNDTGYTKFTQALVQYLTQLETRKGGRKRAPVRELTDLLAPPIDASVHTILGSVSPRELPDKIKAHPASHFLMSGLDRFMSDYQRSMGYVGPVRAAPLRYYLPDQPYGTMDPIGNSSAQLIDDWKKHDSKRYRSVGRLLSALELTADLTAKRDSDGILKMMIRPFGHRETSNLTDVGFGVSQALPLVVSDVALPKNSVLLVNQPEVHLHPTAQAQLANYFSTRLGERQYIVETHSEYLINRLRLLAQQGKLDPDKVAIVFFHSSPRSKKVVRKYDIQLQRDGSLKGAPKIFFKTYYADSFALAMGGGTRD